MKAVVLMDLGDSLKRATEVGLTIKAAYPDVDVETGVLTGPSSFEDLAVLQSLDKAIGLIRDEAGISMVLGEPASLTAVREARKLLFPEWPEP